MNIFRKYIEYFSKYHLKNRFFRKIRYTTLPKSVYNCYATYRKITHSIRKNFN